mgnify:CR=1 FL=1
MTEKPFKDASVRSAFMAFPDEARQTLMEMREILFRAADETPGVGNITECLKWGEPSYLPAKSGVGTTVRLAWKNKQPSMVSVFLHCQTNLVQRIREIYPDIFEFGGNRQLSMPVGASLPEEELKHCFSIALTYHLRKNSG